MWHNQLMSPIRIETTLQIKAPLLWMPLIVIVAIVFPDRIWTALLVLVGGTFGIGYYWSREIRRTLRAGRQLRHGWVNVGDRLVEDFEVAKDGWLPVLWVEIQDDSSVPDYNPSIVRSLSTSQIHWHQEAICQHRGQYTLGPWRLISGDPFGIFRVTIHYPVSDEIIIHPPVHRNLPISLPAGRKSGRLRASERSLEATINAATIRPYQPTDPRQWIHWPKSAQTDTLQVRQFDLDASGDLWLLLDARAGNHLGEGKDGTVEQAVILAASLTAQALRHNRAVGLAAYSNQPQLLPPSQGAKQQWGLFRALAVFEAAGTTTLKRSLEDIGNIVRRGSAIMLITASGDAEWLPALLPLVHKGVAINVILLDRQSFGGDNASAGLRNAIRQLGVSCQLLQQGDLGVPERQKPRRGFWEFKTTRTGRVFAIRTPYD